MSACHPCPHPSDQWPWTINGDEVGVPGLRGRSDVFEAFRPSSDPRHRVGTQTETGTEDPSP